MKELNRTNIVLIPKVYTPESLSQVRPISLCIFAYKIISKTMANRLKPMMGNLISLYQPTFVLNRAIQDSILLAQEVFHHLKVKRGGKRGGMAVKLDLNKAYDSVK